MGAWLTIAAACMLVFSLAHHLGLIEKAYAICGEIAGCSMCTVFWGTLLVLLLYGCPLGIAAALSLAVAYVSNWVGLLYDWLSRMYMRLWKRRKNR